MLLRVVLRPTVLVGSLVAICLMASRAARLEQTPPPSSLVEIPTGRDSDLRVYGRDGSIQVGAVALSLMPQADIALWLAGNQWFAMDRVIRAFQVTRPGVEVAVITLPPGLMLQAIKAGGWKQGPRDFPCQPDVYASVSLGHLQELHQLHKMDSFMTYMHNELMIMVAAGNPKGVEGIDDLARPGLRTSMPSPISEGIMTFYGRHVLEKHGVWANLSAGRECSSCQPTETSWFTAVHHRETPERIKAGVSDAGLVWKTEVQAALRAGAPIEGVPLPPEDSMRDEVAYAIGRLHASKAAPNRAVVDAFLEFIASAAVQDMYAGFGFVRATKEELLLRPIPLPGM